MKFIYYVVDVVLITFIIMSVNKIFVIKFW